MAKMYGAYDAAVDHDAAVDARAAIAAKIAGMAEDDPRDDGRWAALNGPCIVIKPAAKPAS